MITIVNKKKQQKAINFIKKLFKEEF